MRPCSSARVSGRSEIKPRAIFSSRFHNSCLSVFDKFRLVSKILWWVSSVCTEMTVWWCPGKDPEAESRPRDYFVVFSSRGAGRRWCGGPTGAGVPRLSRMVVFETLTVSEFGEIHAHLKIRQNISFCLTSLVNLQEKANLNSLHDYTTQLLI